MRRLGGLGIGAFPVLALLACATARLATPGGEAKLGADAAALVEKEIGLVHAPELESYVSAIGKRLAANPAARADIAYRFSVVDMPEPNAFALPGGFVYVSRGLLALLSNEDELAAVIAHEIGHVAARHHLRHALLEAPLVPVRLATGIGSLAVGIVSPTLGGVVGALGSAPGSLTLARHSRSQEDDADTIGQQLVAAAGWDPRAMSAVMDALSRDEELAGGDPNRESFLDTHPTTPARARRTLERAATLHVASTAPIAADVRHFYEKLDGLLYGDPASYGVVVGREFLHPDLGVRVAFPKDWQIVNAPGGVAAAPEAGDALAVFTIAAKGDDPVAVANQVISHSSLRGDDRAAATEIGGFPAARVTGRSRAGWFSHYRHVVAWVAHGEFVYEISGTALERDWPRYHDALAKVAKSFRALAPRDRKRITEARIRVVDVQRGEDLPAVLDRVGSTWSPERAAAFNGLGSVSAALRAGQPLKVARREVYSGQRDGGER